MPDARRDAEASARGFWRCAACATPNPGATYVKACLGCGAARPARPVPAGGPAAGPTVVIRPVRGRWISAASWAYAVAVLVVLALIRLVGNAWWVGTLLLFMPRWLLLIPAVVLATASGLRRCFGHWILQGAAAAVVLGPLMGLCLPVGRLGERIPAGERLRIATFNLGLEPIRGDAFRRWVVREDLDVICFQEGGAASTDLLPQLPEGWAISPNAYVATRLPILERYPKVIYDSVGGPDRLYAGNMERLRLRARSGREFVVASVHLPTMRKGFRRLLDEGDAGSIGRNAAWWSKQLAQILATLADTGALPLLIGGDFNMPPDDATMAALGGPLRPAFDEAGWGYGYTRPARYPWVRIDHILAGPSWSVRSCRVGPDFGSDHLPVVAEVVLSPSGPAKP